MKNKLVRSSCAYAAVIPSENNMRRTSKCVRSPYMLMFVLMFMRMSLLYSLAYACMCLCLCRLVKTGLKDQPFGWI